MKKLNTLFAMMLLSLVLSSCDFGYCDLVLRTGLRPDKTTISVGETIRLTPYDESCGASGEIPPLTWSSTKPEVASTKSNTGEIRGESEGTAYIMAEAGGEKGSFIGSAEVTVTSP